MLLRIEGYAEVGIRWALMAHLLQYVKRIGAVIKTTARPLPV